MNLKEKALRVAALKTLLDRIAIAHEEARGELFPALLEAHEAMGAKSIDVTLGSVKVAAVSLTQPKGGIAVTDRSAFDAWVAETYPNEVETVTTVRVKPDFEKALLANSRASEPCGTDVVSPDGEFIDGVSYREAGAPTTFSVRFEAEGREKLAEAFTRGELEHVVPLALPRGGDDA